MPNFIQLVFSASLAPYLRALGPRSSFRPHCLDASESFLNLTLHPPIAAYIDENNVKRLHLDFHSGGIVQEGSVQPGFKIRHGGPHATRS